MFVGRGFSRDISDLISSGVLTPEGFKTHFSETCSDCSVFGDRTVPISDFDLSHSSAAQYAGRNIVLPSEVTQFIKLALDFLHLRLQSSA